MGNIFGTAVNVFVGTKVIQAAVKIKPRKKGGSTNGKKKKYSERL